MIVRAELIGSRTAVVAGITVTGYAPVLDLCRELLALGYAPETQLDAYRGDILALRVSSIGKGARLVVEDDCCGKPTFGRLRKCRESTGTASHIR